MPASYACHADASRGRFYQESVPKHRSAFQRDRDRIIHSVAFRRLEYKTQVFVNHEGDLYRTRLTHSLEVSQIARSIARAMQLDEDLVEAIALAHDLGHTPFGHAGQDALNACMKPWGGFEHNLQSLRVVDYLEYKYADFPGLNLTFEAREGILKHCSLSNAKTLGEVGLRFLNKEQASLEAQLTNLADEIAYNNHDIDDGLRSGLINLEQLQDLSLFSRQYQRVCKHYPNLEGRRLIHETIRRMIDHMIGDLIQHSLSNIRQSAVTSVDDVRQYERTLISFSDELRQENQALKQFLRKNLYQHYRVCRMTSKARRVIKTLFTLFMENVSVLPEEHQRFVRDAENVEGEQGRARRIADYIAGMTDRYAIREYQRLVDPTIGV